MSDPMGGSLQLANRCDLCLLGRLVSEKGRFLLQVSLGGVIMQDLCCTQITAFLCCSFCLNRTGLCEYYFVATVVAKRDFSFWATTARVEHRRQESYPSCAKHGSISTDVSGLWVCNSSRSWPTEGVSDEDNKNGPKSRSHEL